MPDTIPSFEEFLHKLNPFAAQNPIDTLIALDPGETTGVAVFKQNKYAGCAQIDTKDIRKGVDGLNNLFTRYPPTFVVYEDYRVYSWKSDQHKWADLHTPKLIGAIQTMCVTLDCPYHTQMAQQAKGFCTDEKLRAWGMYKRGKKHARDAIRHGAYHILFNQKDLSKP